VGIVSGIVAGLIGLGPAQRDIQAKDVRHTRVTVRVLGLAQIGMTHPGRRLDIAHVFGHAGVGLRHAVERHRIAGLLEATQPCAGRNGIHQLVEQMHHLRAVSLQLLDDLFTCQQARTHGFKILDLGNALVELLDLALQVAVSFGLVVDALIHPERPDEQHQHGRHEGCGQLQEELAFTLLAALGTPRK
jgi:hypothetical protein